MNDDLQIQVRKSDERGKTQADWLDSQHTFSFGHFMDRNHMGFRSLRVINDDRVAPGGGFPTHSHSDMEILTYVFSGALEHKDNMGNGHVIQAGELQAMSAGRGVSHSEFNASQNAPVHFLQIWIEPAMQSLAPQYSEWKPSGKLDNGLTLLASDKKSKGVRIFQDAQLFLGQLTKGEELNYEVDSGRGIWLQQIDGQLQIGDLSLNPGDGAGIENATELTLVATKACRFLLFDLA